MSSVVEQRPELVDDLPDHLEPAPADVNSTAICRECRHRITVGPSGTEYGHARSGSVNRLRVGEKTGPVDRYPDWDQERCPHRPDGVDPNHPAAKPQGE